MKILYILSGLTIFNLLTVSVIASSPKQNNEDSITTAIVEAKIPIPTPTPIIVIKKVIKKVRRSASSAPIVTNNTAPNVQGTSTVQTVATTAPPPTQTTVSGCIITIDGGSYNVTSLRSSHSGGDIFNCGSDMSATFWGKHGQSIFSKMQQYRI